MEQQEATKIPVCTVLHHGSKTNQAVYQPRHPLVYAQGTSRRHSRATRWRAAWAHSRTTRRGWTAQGRSWGWVGPGACGVRRRGVRCGARLHLAVHPWCLAVQGPPVMLTTRSNRSGAGTKQAPLTRAWALVCMASEGPSPQHPFPYLHNAAHHSANVISGHLSRRGACRTSPSRTTHHAAAPHPLPLTPQVADSGLDLGSCYFADPRYGGTEYGGLAAGAPSRLQLPGHRKVVQYVVAPGGWRMAGPPGANQWPHE